MNPDPIDPRLNQSQYRVLRYLAISEDPEGDYLSPTQLRNWHYPELRFWQPKTLLQILGKLAKFEYAYVSGHPGNRKWKISEKGHNYLRFMELDRDGQDHWATDIVASELKFLGGKPADGGQSEAPKEATKAAKPKDTYQRFPPLPGTDDDGIPF